MSPHPPATSGKPPQPTRIIPAVPLIFEKGCKQKRESDEAHQEQSIQIQILGDLCPAHGLGEKYLDDARVSDARTSSDLVESLADSLQGNRKDISSASEVEGSHREGSSQKETTLIIESGSPPSTAKEQTSPGLVSIPDTDDSSHNVPPHATPGLSRDKTHGQLAEDSAEHIQTHSISDSLNENFGFHASTPVSPLNIRPSALNDTPFSPIQVPNAQVSGHFDTQPAADACSADYSPPIQETIVYGALRPGPPHPKLPSVSLSLPSHLLFNFNNPSHADTRLLLTHQHHAFDPTGFSLHRLLLFQSPTLGYSLLNGRYTRDYDGLNLLHVHLTDRFISPVSFEAALRVCYGEPVSSFTGSTSKIHPLRTKAEFSKNWMKESLAFTAAGHLLGLRDVVLRGLEIASKIINWDSIEVALSFALESTEHRKYGASASVVPNSMTHTAYDSDSSTTNTILTPGTSQDSPDASPSPVYRQGAHLGNLASSTDVTCADDLLLRCLHFIATHLPQSWTFDPAAAPLAHVDRLPTVTGSESPVAKSRLSKIQFGDLPSETAKASSLDNTISSIMLSLPFASLRALVHFEERSLRQLLPRLIEEREQRRTIAFRRCTAGQTTGITTGPESWSEVGYREQIDVADGRPSLARTYVGVRRNDGKPSWEGNAA